MAKAARNAYRDAVHDAKAFIVRRERERVYEKQRNLTVLAGFGLSFVMLGGLTGAYMAGDQFPGNLSGPSVAIRLIEDGAGPVASSTAATRVALGDMTAIELPVPEFDRSWHADFPALSFPNLGRRAALGAARDALGDSGPLPGDEERLTEAREAALARLYEEPLEIAAEPVDIGTRRQAALPSPTLPNSKAPDLSTPDLVTAGQPAWQRFAVPVASPGARPMIAVVLDDLGLNRPGTRRAIALPGPLTLSFMTYAEGLGRMAEAARAAGHELMLHVPMAPRDSSFDPGPNVLSAELPAEELMRRLEWGLGRFDGFVGVNNHMGSRFTTSPRGMARVMGALKVRGLLFLDSLTARSSVGAAMARRAGVPYAARDVFLDNAWNDRDEIVRQFAQLEAVALRQGSAVGIGHPHRLTLDVLARWLPEARARGFAIVPVSAIVRHRRGFGQQYVETSG